MPRLRIQLPETFTFETTVTVRVDDVNYGGHLSNDRMLTLCHEARVRFLAQYGYSETDIEGQGIIMTDAAIVYKAEAFRGDELTIAITPDNWNKYGCDFFYKISHSAKGKEIARVKTGIIFFDYQKRRIKPCPPEFFALFNNPE